MTRRRANERPVQGVTLHASLEGSACIKHDGDGSASVRFSVPATEAAKLAELAMRFCERPLVVVVMHYDPAADPNRRRNR